MLAAILRSSFIYRDLLLTRILITGLTGLDSLTCRWGICGPHLTREAAEVQTEPWPPLRWMVLPVLVWNITELDTDLTLKVSLLGNVAHCEDLPVEEWVSVRLVHPGSVTPVGRALRLLVVGAVCVVIICSRVAWRVVKSIYQVSVGHCSPQWGPAHLSWIR